MKCSQPRNFLINLRDGLTDLQPRGGSKAKAITLANVAEDSGV